MAKSKLNSLYSCIEQSKNRQRLVENDYQSQRTKEQKENAQAYKFCDIIATDSGKNITMNYTSKGCFYWHN